MAKFIDKVLMGKIFSIYYQFQQKNNFRKATFIRIL